ncbi:hypothetical protein EDD22DRAFT_1015734 [Suillus occidentalis]|nr:hypothetical protein EDD22DRAFT_1015734 [Suillus occidentalis]
MARPLDQEQRTRRSHSTLARITVPPTVVSSNDGASLFVPPSPTLSTQSSVHFATSLSLRDNKPDEHNGYSSLHLLSSPMDKLLAHHRKSSNATFASSHEGHSSLDKTEPDHTSGDYGMVHLHPVRSDPTSTTPSPTHTHVDTASVLSRSQHAKSDISSNVRWTIEGLLVTLQACSLDDPDHCSPAFPRAAHPMTNEKVQSNQDTYLPAFFNIGYRAFA